jgi:hypothetical protein
VVTAGVGHVVVV